MGFYYDWCDEKWKPIDHDRALTAAQRRQLSARGRLIEILIEEISGGDSITALYAGLLARTLVATDEVLMRKYGERISCEPGRR